MRSLAALALRPGSPAGGGQAGPGAGQMPAQHTGAGARVRASGCSGDQPGPCTLSRWPGYRWPEGCPAIDHAHVFGGRMGSMMEMVNCSFYLGLRTKIGYVEIGG